MPAVSTGAVVAVVTLSIVAIAVVVVAATSAVIGGEKKPTQSSGRNRRRRGQLRRHYTCTSPSESLPIQLHPGSQHLENDGIPLDSIPPGRPKSSTVEFHRQQNSVRSNHVSQRSRHSIIVNTRSNQRLYCIIIASSGGSLPPSGADAKLKAGGFLSGVLEDKDEIQKMVRKDSQKELCSVHEVLYCENLTIENCRKEIKEIMQEIRMDHHQDTSVGLLIWYTGHGIRRTGDWPLKNGNLQFKDIYDLYNYNFRNRPLYVVSDCCYSGAWVQDCAKLLDETGIQCGHQAKNEGVLIKVFAACLPNEKARDKYFIKCKGATYEDGTKTICFAKHRRLETVDEPGYQHTLGVDFTFGDNHLLCVQDERGECRSVSTWSKYVQGLMSQNPATNQYLV